MQLRRLHRRFGHPSAHRLLRVLQRAGHSDVSQQEIDKLTKFCQYCQKHGKSPGRFKFSLKDDVDFNHSIIVDVMYIDTSPILHVIDEGTRFQAAQWLTNISAKHTFDTLRKCWMDTYTGPPDYIIHDAGKNFVSKEFIQYAATMSTKTKSVPIEAHWSIGAVERYHAVIKRAYAIIASELESSTTKEMMLQMAVKAVNDTAGPDGLVPTLLVFGAYPRMADLDPPAPTVLQRQSAIRKAMNEINKLRATRQVSDALSQRNGPSTMALYDLPINSKVWVWREHKGWTGPHHLLGIRDQICTVKLSSGPTEFRTTQVKPHVEEEQDRPQGEPEHIEPVQQEDGGTILQENPDDVTSQEVREVIQPPHSTEEPPSNETNGPQGRSLLQVRIPPIRLLRAHANAQTFFSSESEEHETPPSLALYLPDEDEIDDIEYTECYAASAVPPTSTIFVESRRKEVNGLMENGVFRLVKLVDVPENTRIFNSRFVDEIKNEGTDKAFPKSRLPTYHAIRDGNATQERGNHEHSRHHPSIYTIGI
ncbi:similar to putative integrase [Botrytis cinerea T4]|uniref:Similar to putative integrase n=1 Tax=Botryotinia fuckeliana (strain T4) TaxID=999810 RepID=G2YK89_BOTF4|nr:similar to putative integrase [Botrytis cinerea T4]